MIIQDDYRPGDEFDFDQSDPRQFCKHGRFIGPPNGPDILCGWCEMGLSVEAYAEFVETERVRHLRDFVRWEVYSMVGPILATFPMKDPSEVSKFILGIFDGLRDASVEELDAFASA